jgi:hypothetical protein
MTISLRPFEDYAALAVFNALDPHDHMEAEAVRGASATALALFADWRMVQGHGPLSLVAHTDTRPFAVITLGNTGQAGVADAAMLACNHQRFARPLARLAVMIRNGLPGYARDTGIRRIEARSWAGHPTASRLLQAMGFCHNCDMPGFGGSGHEVFRQFAWTAPLAPHPAPACAAVGHFATGEQPCA